MSGYKHWGPLGDGDIHITADRRGSVKLTDLEPGWMIAKEARTIANAILEAADYTEGKNQMTEYTPVPIAPRGVRLSSGICIVVLQIGDSLEPTDVTITDGKEISQNWPITRDDIQKIHDCTCEILNRKKENI